MKYYKMKAIESFLKSIRLRNINSMSNKDMIIKDIQDTMMKTDNLNYNYVCNSDDLFKIENRLLMIKKFISLINSYENHSHILFNIENLGLSVRMNPSTYDFTIVDVKNSLSEYMLLLESINMHESKHRDSIYYGYNYKGDRFINLFKIIMNKYHNDIVFNFTFPSSIGKIETTLNFNTIQLMYEEINERDYKCEKYKERML